MKNHKSLTTLNLVQRQNTAKRLMNKPLSNLGSILLVITLGCACLLPASMRAGGTNTVVEPKVSGVHLHPDLSKYDLNKNGRLDLSEMQAFQQDFARQRAQSLQAKAAELRQMRLLQLARQGIPRIVPPAVLQQYDANKNGVLDPDEWARYRADQFQKRAKAAQPAAAPAPSPARAAPSGTTP